MGHNSRKGKVLHGGRNLSSIDDYGTLVKIWLVEKKNIDEFTEIFFRNLKKLEKIKVDT